MKIRIDDLPDDGIHVDASAADPWVNGAVAAAWEGETKDASTHLHVNRVVPESPMIRVRGKAHAIVERECDRCQSPLRYERSGPVDLYYVPEGSSIPDQGRLHKDDLDIGWYDGKELDLTDVLSEQLALWYPGRLLCADEGVTSLVPDPANHVCALPKEAGPMEEPGSEKKQSPFAGLRLPGDKAE